MIKKGDKVKVRLSNGEVVEAAYNCPSECGLKTHIVNIGGDYFKPARTSSKMLAGDCRFVGNPCILQPAE